MYLLYLDDSGSIDDPQTDFFVLGGICIFERQTHWVESHLNTIAKRFDPLNPENIELHASPMRSGRDGWKAFAPADRVQAVVDALHILSNPHSKILVFGAVIEKALLPIHDIVPHAFEKLAVIFDNYLAARYQLSKKKDPQRGIVIFDTSMFAQSIQSLSYVFKHHGHANGYLRNFAEVPLFLDSKASRLIQLADLVAYWIFRRYQSQDSRGFDLIAPYFHRYHGGQQGLYELISPATTAKLSAPTVNPHPFPAPTPFGSVLPAVAGANLPPVPTLSLPII